MDNLKIEEVAKKPYRNEYLLKDGQRLIVRIPDESDAQGLIDQTQTVDRETKFLSREANEFNFTLEEEREFIRNTLNDKKSWFLIAELGGKIIASSSVGLIRNQKRYLHRAIIGIAVCKANWNMGIGKILMQECIVWCKEQGIEQLELNVISQNDRAVSLYKSLGFEIYGTKKHAFKYIDGTYADEYAMILFINDDKRETGETNEFCCNRF